MKNHKRTGLAALVLSSLSLPVLAAPVGLQVFLGQAKPAPHASIRYGTAPVQEIDVYLPAPARTPHPVVILIHGGCWKKTTAGREQLRALGADLAKRGWAAWSIGYRRVDEEGGAYPGIFQDVGLAIDAVRGSAARYNLDTSRVVVVGHSAGGHLALWAAGRRKLPRNSPAFTRDPLPIRAAIALGGIGDLATAAGVPDVCGPSVLPALLGKASRGRPDVYADTSPARLVPNDVDLVAITGAEDSLAVPAYARAYFDAAKAAGGRAELVLIPEAGHWDVVTAATPAWQVIVSRIAAALGGNR